MQVDFLKLLYDKMLELHNKHADGPEEWQYPRPSFKVHIWLSNPACWRDLVQMCITFNM